MITSIEQLCELGYLVPELSTPSPADDFVSYLVKPGFLITTRSHATGNYSTVTYVQYITTPGDPEVWVVQLESSPENPNNYPPHVGVEVEIYGNLSILL